MTVRKGRVVPWFSLSDINGFWALFADNLANMIMVSVLCTSVLKIPEQVVVGRVLPALGVTLLVGLAFYAWQARRLSRREGRLDVTSLPYGISTPILFAYVFLIMKPAYEMSLQAGQDPLHASMFAWRVGVGAAFVGGVIEALGALWGPWLKRHLPRAGMLGTLAGIALVWIAAVPLAQIFEKPIIGFSSLAIVFAGLVAQYRMPFGVPAGLAAIVMGTAVGALTGDVSVNTGGFGLYLPVPVLSDIVSGVSAVFSNPWVLGVVVPAEIYNFIETMNNVESAEAAGDSYPVGVCQLMDGVGTMVGAFFGSPFPTTVYIGHPGYKRMGARAGYALGVGTVFFFGSVCGFVAFLYRLIPVAAVAPMLVFIGMVITAQAFSASPRNHGMAVAIAMVPHVSNLLVAKWMTAAKVLAGSTGILFAADTVARFREEGAYLLGHLALYNGSIVIGLLWGSMVAFLLDRKPLNAALVALACTILTGFGIVHGSRVGLQLSPLLWAYLVVTGICAILHLMKDGGR